MERRLPRPGRKIAIIGAGFSGTLLAVHLLRHAGADDRVAARIAAARNSGQLTIERARLGQVTRKGRLVDVELRPVRGAAAIHRQVERVINCSGPLGDIERIPSPLVQALLKRGSLRADPLGIGLDVTNEGAAIDRRGRVCERLYAVGPITRGIFWESTAVPDIRLHCEALAGRLLAAAPAET